jgi:inhibitor of KinA sporulation pathway (predicted exonuclease)
MVLWILYILHIHMLFWLIFTAIFSSPDPCDYCKQIVSVIQKNFDFSIKSSFFSVIWKKIIISLSTYQLWNNVCWITTHMYFDIDSLIQLNFLYFSSVSTEDLHKRRNLRLLRFQVSKERPIILMAYLTKDYVKFLLILYNVWLWK